MQAFEQAGYDRALGRVTLSNRPDLCEYQCNGAMAGAKQYKKAPIMIANDVAAKLADSADFAKAEAVETISKRCVLTESMAWRRPKIQQRLCSTMADPMSQNRCM